MISVEDQISPELDIFRLYGYGFCNHECAQSQVLQFCQLWSELARRIFLICVHRMDHSGQNKMGHSILAGMELSIPSGMDLLILAKKGWFIPFRLDRFSC